jgi:hypothetical protein
MSHKLDPVLDAGLRPEASFMKSQNGEKWGYIDTFKHEQGRSKCVFETDEDGSFLQLTLMNEDVGEENVPELLEVINIMNGIQDQVRFFYHLGNGSLFAKREFIVEGRKPKKIQEMVFERYDRMKDIFDDVLWAFDWKVKTGGDFEALFEALAKHNEDRKKRKDRNKGKEGFDPAYA